MEKEQQGISSELLGLRFQRNDIHGAISMPIYSGAAFEFNSAEEMADAFQGKSGKHTYSRISNPTVAEFENRVKKLSKAEEVIAVSSGMAAISNVFMAIAYTGSNIVTSPHLFGNTFSLFLFTLKTFGVEVRFCNMLDPEEVKKNIDNKTCAVFTEIISNPHMEVVDLKKLAEITRQKNIPLIVDSTIIPWPYFDAEKFGVNIEVVSSTKYISGGATSIGGLIIDHQTFDWTHSFRLGEIAKEKKEKALTFKLRSEIVRNMGAYMSPHTAYLQSLGLETLSLRFEKSSKTCKSLASFLENTPGILRVDYPGLPGNAFYELSKEQFGDYPGSMLTFFLEDKQSCFAFLNRLKLIRRATNLFDNKSLIIHPESTIYGTFNEEYKKTLQVPGNMIRLSVGLEELEDLKEDIIQAIK